MCLIWDGAISELLEKYQKNHDHGKWIPMIDEKLENGHQRMILVVQFPLHSNCEFMVWMGGC